MLLNDTPLPRRALLKAGAALPILATAGVLSQPIAAASDPDGRIEALWAERAEIMREVEILGVLASAAVEKLPWWARPGPVWLNSDGSFSGEGSGWPAIQDMQPSEFRGALRKVRPDPRDIKMEFERSVSLWPQGREKARAIYRRHMRELVQRLRAKRAIEEELGIPQMNSRIEALVDRQYEIEKTLRAMAKTSDAPSAIMAGLMVTFQANVQEIAPFDEATAGDPLCWEAEAILNAVRLLRPQVVGLLREHADELLDHPERRFKDMALFGGPERPAEREGAPQTADDV
jgi:hypothetical protein